jgi:hypothetical protein
MYGKLVEVLAECLKPTTNEDHSHLKVSGGISVELDSKAIQTICESISPYYQKGFRHLLVFGLSGLSHKLDVSLESAINMIQILADNDEERSSRITVLQDTYKKDAKDVAGYSSLLETLEHIIGDKNTVKKLLAKIVNVITQAVTSNEDQDLVLWLSNTIMKEFTFRTMTDTKEIYCFDGAKYVRGEEWRIEELCQIILPSIRTGSVQEVINHIKRATWIKRREFDCDPNIRSVDNGLLNIHTRELTPHTADHLSVVQIPVKYDPEVKCPEIEKFLKQVLRAKIFLRYFN